MLHRATVGLTIPGGSRLVGGMWANRSSEVTLPPPGAVRCLQETGSATTWPAVSGGEKFRIPGNGAVR